jgi:hypothetical protein
MLLYLSQHLFTNTSVVYWPCLVIGRAFFQTLGFVADDTRNRAEKFCHKSGHHTLAAES